MASVNKFTREVSSEEGGERILEEMSRCEPFVVREYASKWPAVIKGQSSDQSLADYLKSFDLGRDIVSYIGDSGIAGRFFYTEAIDGVNFKRIRQKLGRSIDQILIQRSEVNPKSIYSGAINIAENIPGFLEENYCGIAGENSVARIWIGNKAVVSTHYDMLNNVVCVVAGRRRFTLFPPAQLPNLYVGPIDFTLSGQPVSMVDLLDPDFEKYPRFREALNSAQVADVGPGDALFIPKLWWHHVQATENFNVIVNYWWDSPRFGSETAFTAMLYGLMTIPHLPEPERLAWRSFFDHYVFRLEGDPLAHLSPQCRGILGDINAATYQKIKALIESLR